MLDKAEQQALDELERQLAAEDPDLGTRLRQHHRHRHWLHTVAITVTLVLAVGLLWLGLPGHALLITAVAGIGTLIYRPSGAARLLAAATARLPDRPNG